MKKVETVETVETVEIEPSYTKGAILKSKRYAERVDALSFLLHDGESYTHEQVENILKNYYEKEV